MAIACIYWLLSKPHATHSDAVNHPQIKNNRKKCNWHSKTQKAKKSAVFKNPQRKVWNPYLTALFIFCFVFVLRASVYSFPVPIFRTFFCFVSTSILTFLHQKLSRLCIQKFLNFNTYFPSRFSSWAVIYIRVEKKIDVIFQLVQRQLRTK